MFESGKSVHELWDTFKTELLQTVNDNVPSKMFKTNTATPWIRGKAKRVLRRKARIYRRARKLKTGHITVSVNETVSASLGKLNGPILIKPLMIA